MTSAKETRKPMIHHFGVRRDSTIALILSVTEAKSCPGPRIGAFANSSAASLSLGLSAMSHSALDPWCLFDLRTRVAQLRQICRSGPRVQVFQKFVIAVVRFKFGHAAIRIVDVSKDDCLRRARLLAGGDNFAVPDRS